MKCRIAVEMIDGDTREWVIEGDNFDFGSTTDFNFFIITMDNRRILINRDKVLSIDVSPVTIDDTVGTGE